MFQYLDEGHCRQNAERWHARVVPRAAAEGAIGGWLSSITALETVGLACEHPEAVVPRDAEVAVVQKLVGLVIVTRRGVGMRVADLLFSESGQIYSYLAAGLERDPDADAHKPDAGDGAAR